VKESEAIVLLDNQAVRQLGTLFASDGDLRQAVNEITALLTPARWAYSDVVPEANLTGAEESLELQADRFKSSDGSLQTISARFLLNTSELNTLALAIFLLCARRVDNVLRVLVLDDPLQNMDELTVTTMARGLGRLLRLWQQRQNDNGPPWRVFLLVHGEEDMERIRNEVPCAAYFLPWLSPGDSPDTQVPEIRPEASRLSTGLQSLDNLITLTPSCPWSSRESVNRR